jgi:site-specific DNA-cytosine methylase
VIGLSAFKARVQRLDADFLDSLARIRAGADFKRVYGTIDATVFGQTSVIGFHETLGLPLTSTTQPALGPLVWADHETGSTSAPGPPDREDLEGFAAHRQASALLSEVWESEVEKLRARTAGKGKGQLASSAGRIRQFLDFLKTEPAREIQAAWLAWRSLRDALRRVAFGDDAVEQRLRSLYRGDRRVDVLLGGPPCQGFSRIGRGKIRSLREHHVHVETDPGAGDARNRLLLKYVLFVSVLEPRAFLFENVRHFQASVKTPEGTFLATEILNEAIQELSRRRLSYRVKDRIVDCSRHLIPQTRERFVMAGVRSDVAVPSVQPEKLPEWCLALPSVDAVPLRMALTGLPSPLPARGQRSAEEPGLSATLPVSAEVTAAPGPAGDYLRWVRQPAPPGLPGRDNSRVDAHSIRPPRADDQALFALLGPGTRWMDYRCDDSPTLRQLRELVERVQQILEAAGGASDGADSPLARAIAALGRPALEGLADKLDGSLPLRLLLESIPPREGELHHHLLTPAYLGKREGNNGDWVARLHPDRPAKTVVSHMGKDTYAYVHPSEPRTLSVREAARIQTFPDWFRFGRLGLVEAFRAVGNAVPPLLSYQFAGRVAQVLRADDAARTAGAEDGSTHRGQRRSGASAGHEVS